MLCYAVCIFLNVVSMTTVLFARADLFSVWITLSELSGILGDRFANSLQDSYASFYERVNSKPYVPDPYDTEPSFRLDVVFAFINDYINKYN